MATQEQGSKAEEQHIFLTSSVPPNSHTMGKGKPQSTHIKLPRGYKDISKELKFP